MKTITLLSILLLSSVSFAQVGIGTTTPDNSAALDVKSTNKGFLPPRMTENERDAITTPAAGLIVWCTNCGSDGEVQVFNGTTWTNLIGGSAAEGPPQIGDFRDGGVVFYVAPSPTDLNGDGSLDTGLVCAIEDQSALITWTNKSYGNFITTGATAINIGTGKANTDAIISNLGSGNYAAAICDNYSITLGGTIYNDWFLPSKVELDEMYQNKSNIDATANSNGGSDLASIYYWNSTEDSAYNSFALEQLFNGSYNPGEIRKSFKTSKNGVRAVRAF